MTTSVQANVAHNLPAGTPAAPTKTDAEVAAFAAAYGTKVTTLLTEAGLTRDNTVSGQVDFIAAPPTYTNPGGGSSGTSIDLSIGFQWWKLGGSRAANEPVYIKLEYILRRFVSGSNLQFTMHLKWSVTTLTPTWGLTPVVWTNIYQNSTAGVGNTATETYEACVRDDSFSILLGPVGTQSSNQGFFHFERLVNIDGTIPSTIDRGVLVTGSGYEGNNTILTRHWLVRTWSSTAIVRSGGCCPAPTGTSIGTTPNGADNFVYPAVVFGPPVQAARNVVAYYSGDPFVKGSLYSIPMLGGGSGMFKALGDMSQFAINSGSSTLRAMLRWE